MLFCFYPYLCNARPNCTPVELKFNADTPTITIQQLQSLNLSSYYGKPIDSLLLHLQIGYEVTRVWGHKLGVASRISIYYPSNVSLDIFVKEFQVLPNYRDRSGNWNLSLFKKENIFTIALF